VLFLFLEPGSTLTGIHIFRISSAPEIELHRGRNRGRIQTLVQTLPHRHPIVLPGSRLIRQIGADFFDT